MDTNVSVIIPAYNQARWLPETIRSALAQHFKPLEIIIVDDGSPDDTSAVAQSFGNSVTLIRKANEGLSAARNTGILASRGEWLVFLDSDDVLPQDFISRHLQTATKNEAHVVFAGYFPTDANGQTIGSAKFGGLLPGESALEALLRGNAFPPHAAMTRRGILGKVGLFDAKLTSYEDWDFWLRIAGHGGRFLATDGLTVPYRQHPTSMSKNAERMFANGLEVLRKVEQGYVLNRRARRTLINARWGLRQNFISCTYTGLSTQFVTTFLKAIRKDPALLLAIPRNRLQATVNAIRLRGRA